MGTEFLTTKIQIPILRLGYIKRPRIEDRLTINLLLKENFTRKITLIAAPAGFGKTSLAVSWLNDLPIKKCWFSIDKEDNDPVRFLIHSFKSLQTAEKTFPEFSPPQPGSQAGLNPKAILAPLINFIAHNKHPFLLVLDDYHLINQLGIHQLMDFLLQNMPANLHLVIISREDPPFPLHNLRAKGQILEIRQKDLEFTNDETKIFLRGTFPEILSEDEARLITRRTEGWITGIQLTTLSLRNHANPKELLREFGASSRFVLDYLFQEIFQAQEKRTREFLVRTSILRQISSELASAVTGFISCSDILQELERSNLFIHHIENGGKWYRYHHLFRELLSQQLRLQNDIVEEEIHLAASRWYEENNLLEESIYHAIEGKQWEHALKMIGKQSDYLLKNGLLATLLTWMRNIPPEYITQTADSCLIYTWPLLLTGQYEEAEEYLQKAKNAPKQNKEDAGKIAAARAFLAQSLGDQEALIRNSELALSLTPEENASDRGIIAMNLGIAYWHLGEMMKARAAFQNALPASRKSENTYAEITSQFFLARVYAVMGRLDEAAESILHVIQFGKGIPIASFAITDLAIIHYERNDLVEALNILQKGWKTITDLNNPEFIIASCMIKIRILGALNQTSEVKSTIKECQNILDQHSIPDRTLSRWASFQIELAIKDGEIGLAREWLDKFESGQDAHPFYRFLELSPIRLLIAEGKNLEAKKLIVNACAGAEKHGWNYGRAWLIVHLALVEENEKKSLAYLEESLNIGLRSHFLRTYADAGADLLPLLRKSAATFHHTGYIQEIIQIIEQESAEKNKLLPSGSRAPTIREMEILRLVAAGLTNRQIAEQMVVSISTVKSHVHHICEKLDAENRTEAAARARKLGLIQ